MKPNLPSQSENVKRGAEDSGPTLRENEFLLKNIPAGKIGLVRLNGEGVAVYNLGGRFFATSSTCTHEGGSLNEGDLSGEVVECPLHGSCFNVTSGAVVCGPAETPVGTFAVTINGEIGRVS